MTRNFGFPSETSREIVGGDQSPGPLHGAIHTRADNVISLFCDDERSSVVRRGGRVLSESQPAGSSSFRESGYSSSRSRLTSRAPFSVDLPNSPASGWEPFIREFAACVLVGLYVLTPAIFVTATVVLYALLVAQPVEY